MFSANLQPYGHRPGKNTPKSGVNIGVFRRCILQVPFDTPISGVFYTVFLHLYAVHSTVVLGVDYISIWWKNTWKYTCKWWEVHLLMVGNMSTNGGKFTLPARLEVLR